MTNMRVDLTFFVESRYQEFYIKILDRRSLKVEFFWIYMYISDLIKYGYVGTYL